MQGHIPITEEQRLTLDVYVKLMRAESRVTAKMHRHLSNWKLTASQFGVLEALLHLGSMSQQALGKKILKSGGNITMVVDNLEKRRLVTRETDPGDRRRTRINLTPKGNAIIREIFPKHALVSEHVFSVLDETECRLLGSLLKKLGRAQESIP
jgi:MarR family transcriptional regulator, 2-MHQ and catechol-resistance regulon repressor